MKEILIAGLIVYTPIFITLIIIGVRTRDKRCKTCKHLYADDKGVLFCDKMTKLILTKNANRLYKVCPLRTRGKV